MNIDGFMHHMVVLICRMFKGLTLFGQIDRKKKEDI